MKMISLQENVSALFNDIRLAPEYSFSSNDRNYHWDRDEECEEFYSVVPYNLSAESICRTYLHFNKWRKCVWVKSQKFPGTSNDEIKGESDRKAMTNITLALAAMEKAMYQYEKLPWIVDTRAVRSQIVSTDVFLAALASLAMLFTRLWSVFLPPLSSHGPYKFRGNKRNIVL